jgi:hypothetical protein
MESAIAESVLPNGINPALDDMLFLLLEKGHS